MVQKVPNLMFKTTSAHPVKAATPAANRLLPVLLVTGMPFDGVDEAPADDAVLLLLLMAAIVVEEELKTILRHDEEEEEEDERPNGGEKAIETSIPHSVAKNNATTIIVTALRTNRPGFRRICMLFFWLGTG